MNWNEAGLHRAMGFGAMLLAMPWLLTRRERLQNPQENKKNPVKWIDSHRYAWDNPGTSGYRKEYWSATRVRDGQKDTHDYCIGFSIAWPFIFGAGLLVGWRFL